MSDNIKHTNSPRFYYNLHTGMILDNGKELMPHEAMKLLNKQDARIKDLEKRLKVLDDAFMDFEERLYLEVFDIEMSAEEKEAVCEMCKIIGEDLLKKNDNEGNK